MKGTLVGLLLTAAMWIVLVGLYAGIEWVRGHQPFAMFQWHIGGKFVASTVLLVLGLGAVIGYTSDRIRRGQRG
jgi:apolipoprotein N-acyltransferase